MFTRVLIAVLCAERQRRLEYWKQYRIRNRAIIAQKAKERPEKNRAKKLAYWREYNRVHREKRKAYARQYWVENRERLLEENKVRWQEKREARNAYRRAYVKNNPEKARQCQRASYRKYRKERVEKVKAYAKINRDHINARTRDLKNRSKEFAMLCRVRARFSGVLQGTLKADSTRELIGCSAQDLRQHLESLFLPGMSWENRNLWVIDHIYPCAGFDFTDEDQQRECFHYSNLRPLWKHINHRKSDQCPDAFHGGLHFDSTGNAILKVTYDQ